MENTVLLKADHLTVTINSRIVIEDLSFTIHKSERWVIAGDSGTGKTSLLHVIAGFQFFRGSLEKSARSIVMVEQQHHFKNLSNTTNFYYQQRFNSSDSEDAITVQEDLLNHVNNQGDENLQDVISSFHLTPLLDERLIQLSNGENKRLQIAKAILDKPDLLLLDSPFTGLDTEARVFLEALLEKISSQGIAIIIAMNTRRLPSFVTHVLTLKADLKYAIASPADIAAETLPPVVRLYVDDSTLFDELVSKEDHLHFEYAVKMESVNISYHNKKILNDISWQVKKGECWSLSGHNGAGKSTLLSLITADNPQAYANNIFLFDRKRGSGETIWEIKKKIGYISPELHLHFDQSNTAFEVVASGLFDTIGLFRQLNDEQVELVGKWMRLLKIDKLRNKVLSQLSNSEQRIVLLARALVKNPPMLVLDEPCQGLDEHQVEAFKSLINEICIRGSKTLIYVSHYTDEIPPCVTKHLRLQNGGIEL